MVTHYFTAPENVACGRAGANLNGSQDLAEVSCKLCLRSADKKVNEPVRKTPSLAELRAAAKAEKAAQAEAAASLRTVRVARGEWQQRLAQLPGRSRLPRGMAR
ncbi:hypothetical protein [Aquipseudomonas alcaligenes]|uniref:Uncharacterized protein n=1 Tax=Aquipseudomonas alcaligenes TaxID=43263 RepID=A0AA37CJB8_AQUAC|nr:hypothetical protein [Pseudomonas alcaligenes]BCR22749.1 hypothetical protein KAM426_02760 [Pseudomonas alcaligenes]GIZ67862.1 hypothetical protein KAM428_29470 [Pseudomonas alcaligenes]GIZ72377.1 hypothetical protein KAM429_31380 [Pseudomonas alcaligenes]GIZ76728.1 hypothetical protein KAM430_31370 [Pseudomonas alcaligenes]GIZ80882.1 hypothetical protein KAM432_29300 [Pseudomonas alcaligenes]